MKDLTAWLWSSGAWEREDKGAEQGGSVWSYPLCRASGGNEESHDGPAAPASANLCQPWR